MSFCAFISLCIFSFYVPTCTGQRQSFSALRGQIIPDTIEWTYGNGLGPRQWPYLFSDSCAGIYQSPINIWTHNTIYDNLLKDFAIFYDPPQPGSRFEVHNNGHSIEVNTEGEFYLTNGGLRNIYKTGQFHFHWGDSNRYGSEHTIDGKAAPIEMHIVSWNKDEFNSFTDAAEQPGGLSVLGVLFELSPFDNPIFDPLIDVLQYIRDPDRNVLVRIPAISIRKLLPRLPDRYYRYNGSLTTPRCYESVIWTIFEQKQTISERQSYPISSHIGITSWVLVIQNWSNNEEGLNIELYIVYSKFKFVKIMEDYVNDWFNKVNSETARNGNGGNKLRMYKTFKNIYETEYYCKLVFKKTYRGAIAKFRSGTAPIAIELGRYNGTLVENRPCFHCPTTVEDETHVLLHCPLYNSIRTELLQVADQINLD